MSWSVSTSEPVAVSDASTALAALQPQHVEGAIEEVGEQLQAAKDAAGLILDRGVVGGEDRKVRISLAGHATPGHECAEGYASPTISVGITQVE